MGGTPLDHAKRVVTRLIDSLGDDDRFELVEFSDRPNPFRPHPSRATASDKRVAIKWVASREAGGGTEMHTAVVAAMRALRDGAQRQVVLVTDGYIGGEQHIVTTLREQLPANCRLHVVGVGSAPNRALSAALARAGRGAEILIGLDEDPERVTRRLLDRTCAPVLTDVTIEGDAITSRAPEHAPDVFAGSPVLAALQLRPTGGEIVVRGKLARGREWTERVRVPATEPGAGNRAIPALFGRERVADLDVRFAIGHDVDKTVERVGVDFQIATRLTSWVAIDDRPSVDKYTPERSELIPQELPFGTTVDGFGLANAMSPMSAFAPAQAAPMGRQTRTGMIMPTKTMAGGYAGVPAEKPDLAKESRAQTDEPIDLLVIPEPAPRAAKTRPLIWPAILVLAVILALIALLVWWLAF
jgi:Ca-activated chloride channel family protein